MLIFKEPTNNNHQKSYSNINNTQNNDHVRCFSSLRKKTLNIFNRYTFLSNKINPETKRLHSSKPETTKILQNNEITKADTEFNISKNNDYLKKKKSVSTFFANPINQEISNKNSVSEHYITFNKNVNTKNNTNRNFIRKIDQEINSIIMRKNKNIGVNTYKLSKSKNNNKNQKTVNKSIFKLYNRNNKIIGNDYLKVKKSFNSTNKKIDIGKNRASTYSKNFKSVLNSITHNVTFFDPKNNLLTNINTMNLLNKEEKILFDKISLDQTDNLSIKKFSKYFTDKNGQIILFPILNQQNYEYTEIGLTPINNNKNIKDIINNRNSRVKTANLKRSHFSLLQDETKNKIKNIIYDGEDFQTKNSKFFQVVFLSKKTNKQNKKNFSNLNIKEINIGSENNEKSDFNESRYIKNVLMNFDTKYPYLYSLGPITNNDSSSKHIQNLKMKDHMNNLANKKYFDKNFNEREFIKKNAIEDSDIKIKESSKKLSDIMSKYKDLYKHHKKKINKKSNINNKRINGEGNLQNSQNDDIENKKNKNGDLEGIETNPNNLSLYNNSLKNNMQGNLNLLENGNRYSQLFKNNLLNENSGISPGNDDLENENNPDKKNGENENQNNNVAMIDLKNASQKKISYLVEFLKDNVNINSEQEKKFLSLIKQKKIVCSLEKLKRQLAVHSHMSKKLNADDFMDLIIQEIHSENYTLIKKSRTREKYRKKRAPKEPMKLQEIQMTLHIIQKNQPEDDQDLENERLKLMVNEVNLTNELKFHIKKSDDDKENKEKFQKLLTQIGSYKTLEKKEYVRSLRENIEYFKDEIDDILKTKKLEKRLNGFVSNLDKQNNLNESRRCFYSNKVKIKDNKFKILLGEMEE